MIASDKDPQIEAVPVAGTSIDTSLEKDKASDDKSHSSPAPSKTPQQQEANHLPASIYAQQPHITAALQNAAFYSSYGGFMPEFDPRLARNPEELNAMRLSQQQGGAAKGPAANIVPTTDERYHALLEREARWSEVRKFSEYIRRFAGEASHMDITKENYYDLYNMAVCLLKSVDSLDPDKTHIPQRKPSEGDPNAAQQMGAAQFAQMGHPPIGMQQSEFELLQARKSFDYYYNRGAIDGSYMSKYAEMPVFYNQPTAVSTAHDAAAKESKQSSPSNKNYTGEVFFDEGQPEDGKRNKRQRRRRSVYSSRRNLHCHMCGVTETPEWRRGPAGDHTLCNACGLHYAKSLKKQRKDREGRKHSIEMILNQSGQPEGGGGEQREIDNTEVVMTSETTPAS